MRKLVYILFFLFTSTLVFATHNRAGEITYRQISGYTYEITLITYTWTPSSVNEYRDSLNIALGDGTYTQIRRVREEYLPDDYTRNTYVIIHTYPGSGKYDIVMEDPNRNQGINNIFDSVNINFSVKTTLTIDPMLGFNNTPILLNPPTDKAALGETFIHNPAAFDIDGDSLAYRLAICLGEGGVEIPNYKYPNASRRFFVDSITGDLVWDAPTEIGKYNVAMIVEEWRNGVKIGEVERDLQIEVFESNNHKPEIDSLSDICVRANDTVRFTVTARDQDNDMISLSGTGGPFLFKNNSASFPPATGFGTVSSEFLWVPGCTEIRQEPFLTVFKATDNDPDVALSDMEEVNITVIGHPPTALQATPDINSVELSWTPSVCSNAVSYEIYRSTSSQAYTPSYCERGIPESLNYEKIASINGATTTSYQDNNNGNFLSKGYRYCYRMLAVYPDGSQSYVSDEVCTTIKSGLPDFTNVSVLSTSATTGSMYIAWTKPEIDSNLYTPPFTYILYRTEGISGTDFVKIAELHSINDTVYTDNALNTLEKDYLYKLEFWYTDNNTPVLLGSPPNASQPTISLKPSNKELMIKIEENVPWINYKYIIYRKDSVSLQFDSIGTSNTPVYRDMNLVNGSEYCYKIEGWGKYNIGKFKDTLINFSQEVCGIPIDTISPKKIDFNFNVDCDNENITISWQDPTLTDSLEKIEYFRIYYKTCRDDVYENILTLPADSTSVVFNFADSTHSMGGCYYVAAVDSAGNVSSGDNDTCIYSCPKYLLPNVFTPNNDGENDYYTPRVNKYVEKVNMKIYNRWNQLIFETNDPEINWNGYNYKTDTALPDGVFYYVCEVYEKWLDCELHPRNIVGFIHKFSDGQNQKNK